MFLNLDKYKLKYSFEKYQHVIIYILTFVIYDHMKTITY